MLAALCALITMLLVPAQSAAALQLNDVDGVVINELMAANDSYLDNFGDTPDWIEVQNNGSSTVNLEGWTIADDASGWTLPALSLAAGQQLVIFASGRGLNGPPPHADFSLKRSGETITLSDPDSRLVDQVTYPELDDDVAYGRGPAGGIGVLVAATPGAGNSDLAPSAVDITTPSQTFQGSISVSMTGTTRAGEQVRYTTDSSAVTASSPAYTGPITLSTSTVVRAAVVGNGVVGPESTGGYIAVSTSVADFSSDLPLVIVHSTGVVGEDTQDAIVSVIDRAANGRTTVFDEADYNGFGGLRVRGASSVDFPKKQYKFELWGDRLGDEVDADLLGLGADSDWGLYAPGVFDRAMINNPFMYELAKRTGVIAPDYQFVELFIEDNPTATVGDGDYLGLYVLRESIKIDDERVDLVEHTPTSAGPDGGYILRYDWRDSCCANLKTTRFGSLVNVDSPKQTDLTSAQFNYIDAWWDDLEAAASSSFSAADQYIEFDSFIDHWLLEILAMDVDVLRASHYMHKDAGGQLKGGPMWDYDRSLGGADNRINDIAEARAWTPNGTSGHSYLSDVYEDLWDMPEVQARLRARWAELRSPGAVFSDGELSSLIFSMGDEIAEAYVREDARWGSLPDYGSRFGELAGELQHMDDWVSARVNWLDNQFLSGTSAPVLSLPTEGLQITANSPVDYQVQASDDQVIIYTATGLPEGLRIDATTGQITGTVGYGDIYGTIEAEITVTDSGGLATSGTLSFADPAFATPPASPIVLNEYNPVAPGALLENDGADSFFGQVGGNGGDWFELVVVEDRLDLRGWRFDIFSNNDDGDVVQTASLRLGNDDLLSDLRAGTIVTVAESVTEDLSYDPGNGDWAINLQSNNTQAGSLWTNQTNFDTNHKRWRLVIRDDAGTIRSYVGGETEVFRGPANRNVNSTQAMGLDELPGVDATQYAEGNQSTFGAANALSGGGVQDLASLRPELFVPGDANCDGRITLADALMVAQASVGSRDDSGGCPLADPLSEFHAAAADTQRDGRITLVDALTIAQCSVGAANDFCP